MDGGRKEEDGWMDECMKKGGQMSAAGGNVSETNVSVLLVKKWKNNNSR